MLFFYLCRKAYNMVGVTKAWTGSNFVKILQLNFVFSLFCYTFAPLKTRYSAVGSAPRSGRGGRAFESPYLDTLKEG